MPKLTLIATLLTGCIVLGGCASVAHGPSYAEARAKFQPQNEAIVYVFRKYAEPTAWGATIYFDSRKIATLNQKGFTWAYLAPGKHIVRAKWAALSGQKDSTIDLNVTGGKTYYLELVGISQATGGELIGGFMAFTARVGSGLNEVKPEYAQAMLSECEFQKPVSSGH